MSGLASLIVWSALFCLGVGGVVLPRRPRLATPLLSTGWVLFGVYWASMTSHYLYTKDSVIEAGLCIVALPVSVYAAYMVYRESPRALATLGKGIAAMGLIYIPIERLPQARQWAIETVADQTVWAVTLLFNHELVITEGPIYGYQSEIAAPNAPGGLLLTHIELACTGLGSIAIIVGLIAVLDEPVLHRISAAVAATVGIYLLNVLRTVFITSAYIGQWFQFRISDVLAFTGYTDPRVTSFFIADKVIAQSLSALVLVGVILGLRAVFPSFDAVVQEVVSLWPAHTAQESE